MKLRGIFPGLRRALGPGFLLLLIASCLFGLAVDLAPAVALAVAVVGAVGAALLRSLDSGFARTISLLPPLVALGILASYAGVDALSELYAGLTALALLLWLADDPERLPDGMQRSLPTLSVPALGFGLAWASAFVVPAVGAPLGVAVVLLVAVGATVAFLLRTPENFDRDPAATS